MFKNTFDTGVERVHIDGVIITLINASYK